MSTTVRRISVSLLASFTILASSQSSPAQTNAIPSSAAIGFHLDQVQGDLGMGVNITSPTFLADRVGVRLRGSVQFLQHNDADGRATWTPYLGTSLGLIGFSSPIAERIRCYGEGGAVLLFPNADVSTASTEFGGYGLIGFEFFLSEHTAYNIELGAVGTGARADRVSSEPLYNNGFTISTGIRVIL